MRNGEGNGQQRVIYFFFIYEGNTQRGKATIYTLKKKKREREREGPAAAAETPEEVGGFFFPSLYPDDLDARRLLHRGHTDKRENLVVVVVVVLMGLSESSLQTRTFSTLLNSLPPLNLFLFFLSFCSSSSSSSFKSVSGRERCWLCIRSTFFSSLVIPEHHNLHHRISRRRRNTMGRIS